MSGFDVSEIMTFWLTEAEEALSVADHLVEKGDYSYALFFAHLAVEKLLKALYAVKRQEHAPPIHNLLRLARITGIEVDEARTQELITITGFNLEARYPDFRRTFRHLCTPEYTAEQMARAKDLFTCSDGSNP
jgi:HEPN domain-containing protein